MSHNSYKQYKEDTHAFTTWLGNAARACGYELVRQHTIPQRERNQGAHRNTVNAKFRVTTLELEHQIETMATSSRKPTMPAGIRMTLRRAIEARRWYSEWYEKAQPQQAALDGGGHKRFIRILEDAMSRLGSQVTSVHKRNTTKPAKPQAGNFITDSLVNCFTTLALDMPDEIDQDLPDHASERITSTGGTSRSEDFEMEEEPDLLAAFAGLCLFRDVDNIRQELRNVWNDCRKGRISLAAATILTHLNVLKIHRAENEFFETFLSNTPPDGPKDWETIFGVMFGLGLEVMAKRASRPEKDHIKSPKGDEVRADDEARPKPQGADFLHLTLLPVKNTLERFVQATFTVDGDYVAWPQPIPCSREYDQTIQEEDRLLSQLLLDLQLLDYNTKLPALYPDTRFSAFGLALEDVFITALRPVWTEDYVTVTSVATAQIMLDIHASCKAELPLFYEEFSRTYDFTVKFLGHEPDPNCQPNERKLTWNSSDADRITQNRPFIERIGYPSLPRTKDHMLKFSRRPQVSRKWTTTSDGTPAHDLQGCLSSETERQPGMAIAHMIQPAAEEDFALSHNPLYSGSAILMLLMECSTAGLDLANHHLSIFAVAHLYNAVRQLKLLEQPWPIMDRIIELHKRAIFADVVPSTLEYIKARMKYRVGHGKDRRSKTQPQYFMQIPKLSETLSLLLDSDDTDQARALLEMERHMNDTARHGGVSSGTPDLGQTAKGQTNLRRTVGGALEDISIDYATLTNQCHWLLGDMRKYRDLELRLRDRPSAFEDVSTQAGDHFD